VSISLNLASFLKQNCGIINLLIADSSVGKLIDRFLQKGGRIDKYYLRGTNPSKRSLVYLRGWFSGQNIRSAILKAFGKD